MSLARGFVGASHAGVSGNSVRSSSSERFLKKKIRAGRPAEHARVLHPPLLAQGKRPMRPGCLWLAPVADSCLFMIRSSPASEHSLTSSKSYDGSFSHDVSRGGVECASSPPRS